MVKSILHSLLIQHSSNLHQLFIFANLLISHIALGQPFIFVMSDHGKKNGLSTGLIMMAAITLISSFN